MHNTLFQTERVSNKFEEPWIIVVTIRSSVCYWTNLLRFC